MPQVAMAAKNSGHRSWRSIYRYIQLIRGIIATAPGTAIPTLGPCKAAKAPEIRAIRVRFFAAAPVDSGPRAEAGQSIFQERDA